MPTLPLQVGVGRKVPQAATIDATTALLSWQSMGESRRAGAISLRSPHAVGLSLGLEVYALPANATLRVYAQNSDLGWAVPARDVLEQIAINHRAGDDSLAARTWWSPVIDGEEATLEIDLPAELDPAQVKVALPYLSHIFLP